MDPTNWHKNRGFKLLSEILKTGKQVCTDYLLGKHCAQ